MATDRRVRKKFKKYEKEIDRQEELEKEVRELKSINRSLLKQLKKQAKGIHKEEYEEALESIGHGKKEEPGKPRLKECPECSRAAIIEVIVAGRTFHRCNVCDYRSGALRKK